MLNSIPSHPSYCIKNKRNLLKSSRIKTPACIFQQRLGQDKPHRGLTQWLFKGFRAHCKPFGYFNCLGGVKVHSSSEANGELAGSEQKDVVGGTKGRGRPKKTQEEKQLTADRQRADREAAKAAKRASKAERKALKLSKGLPSPDINTISEVNGGETESQNKQPDIETKQTLDKQQQLQPADTQQQQQQQQQQQLQQLQPVDIQEQQTQQNQHVDRQPSKPPQGLPSNRSQTPQGKPAPSSTSQDNLPPVDWRVKAMLAGAPEQVARLDKIKADKQTTKDLPYEKTLEGKLNILPSILDRVEFRGMTLVLQTGDQIRPKDKKKTKGDSGESESEELEVVPGLPEPIPVNAFDDLDDPRTHYKRYYLWMAKLHLIAKLPLDHRIRVTVTALILSSYRFPNTTIPSGHVPVSYSSLTGSLTGILSEAWSRTHSKDAANEIFINVSDSLSNIKRYLYTGVVPTYQEIEETTAVSITMKWLARFFGPVKSPEVDDVNFVKRFLIYLTPRNFITSEKFKQMQPAGCSFKNTFAAVEPPNPFIAQQPYSPDVITLSPPINADYSGPHMADNKVIVSSTTLRFLKVLCGDTSYNLNVLRIFLRNVVCARFEGRHFQSALYLYGSPGTAKSLIAHVARRMCPEGTVQEFSRTQTQFTAGQLADCNLLIVSDLTQITSKQMEVLKRLLGRDTITMEVKYEPEFGLMNPWCQVLIISNFPPEHFPILAGDQAMLDKLIKMYLGPHLAIRQDLQVANMGENIDQYLPEIMNWAMYCRRETLQLFVRAVTLNRLHDQMTGVTLTNLPGFIFSCLRRGDSTGPRKDFISTVDLKAAYNKYLEKSGIGLGDFDKKRKETHLGENLCRCLNDFFETHGITYKISRYSQRKGPDDTQIRPQGIYGLKSTDGTHYINRDDPALRDKVFQLKDRSSSLQELDDPFATDNVVVWFKSGTQITEIDRAQELILADRESRMKDPANTPNDLSDPTSVRGDSENIVANPSLKLLTENSTRPFDNSSSQSLPEKVDRLNEDEPYGFDL